MRWRLGVWLVALLGVPLLVVVVALPLLRAQSERLARAHHVARGETELRIANPAGAALSVRRTRDGLDDCVAVALEGERAWLPEGRYFVEASQGGQRQLFPVTLEGDGRGPEPDTSWAVTVRRSSAEAPPPLEAGLPGFVFIPGGYAVIGDRNNPGQRHAVWVPSFHIASFEATNREFRVFLKEGYEDRSSWTAAGWAWKSSGLSQATARLQPGDARFRRFGRDELPVMLVTWHEADAYCRWLTRRLGGGRWLYRLPTEAEWEKAARGPDAFDYGLGMELSEPQSALYNWRKNPDAGVTLVGFEETRRRYRPNRYGVYHASGNAREWTQSVFRHYNAENPYRDDDRNEAEAQGMRVTRGGSWYSASAVRLQLAYREEFQPELSSDDLGFRVAAVLGAGDEGM